MTFKATLTLMDEWQPKGRKAKNTLGSSYCYYYNIESATITKVKEEQTDKLIHMR